MLKKDWQHLRCEQKGSRTKNEKTGFHTQYITALVSRYKANGLASITGFRNEVFASLEKVVDRLCDTICTLTSDTIKSITRRSWTIDCFNLDFSIIIDKNVENS